jgi:hypothetical protein
VNLVLTTMLMSRQHARVLRDGGRDRYSTGRRCGGNEQTPLHVRWRGVRGPGDRRVVGRAWPAIARCEHRAGPEAASRARRCGDAADDPAGRRRDRSREQQWARARGEPRHEDGGSSSFGAHASGGAGASARACRGRGGGRAGAARQALPLGRHGAERIRLLGADVLRVARGRCRAPSHLARPVRRPPPRPLGRPQAR